MLTLCIDHHNQLEGKNWADFNFAKSLYKKPRRQQGGNARPSKPKPKVKLDPGVGLTWRKNAWYYWKKDHLGLHFWPVGATS